jgi:SAM-dependent methyltransferase/peptidoglycan hydrolase CwlO-like protein
MDDEFYIRLEDKFRGSRELIKERLKIYLPIINPLKAVFSNNLLVDLGCGRGEWLELVNENGWQSLGIDTNNSMVDYCKGLGLDAIKGDASAYLRTLKSETISVVSGFQIAEHLPFELLLEIISEAYRVLLPGGFLILETPNPENIVVGSTNFYLDPTHIHPIPAELLSFLPEYLGFHRIQILRLQESPELISSKTTDLLNVLRGVSQDYAIVAQKNAQPEILALFDNEFGKESGITLETLAQRYDSQVEAATQHFSTTLGDLQTDVNGIRTDLNILGTERDRLQSDLSGARIDLQGLRVDLENARTERDRLQTDLNNAHIDLQNLRVDIENARTERDGLQTMLNEVRTEQNRLQTRLDEVQAERDGLQTRLDEVQAERDGLQIRADKIQADQDFVHARLTQAQSDLEAIQKELHHVYNSRSYRITAPLRAIFGFGRVQREHLYQLRNLLAINTRIRGLLRQTIYSVQHIPLVAVLVEKFKHRYPRTWRKVSTRVKKTINPPQQSITNTSGDSEEELHFLNLFHHEITKQR